MSRFTQLIKVRSCVMTSLCSIAVRRLPIDSSQVLFYYALLTLSRLMRGKYKKLSNIKSFLVYLMLIATLLYQKYRILSEWKAYKIGLFYFCLPLNKGNFKKLLGQVWGEELCVITSFHLIHPYRMQHEITILPS